MVAFVARWDPSAPLTYCSSPPSIRETESATLHVVCNLYIPFPLLCTTKLPRFIFLYFSLFLFFINFLSVPRTPCLYAWFLPVFFYI